MGRNPPDLAAKVVGTLVVVVLDSMISKALGKHRVAGAVFAFVLTQP
jgi:urea transporter